MEIAPFIGSLLGNIVVAIGILLTIFLAKLIKERLHNHLEYITATTVGLLLGIIFLGFLPELSELFEGNSSSIGIFILYGIIIFYIFELFIHWHHCKDMIHERECDHSYSHEHKNGTLMFGGTLLHNSFHGVILFSAFSVNTNFGMVTTLAILLHSIPQNLVNYVMNHHNVKYSYFAAFGGIMGAIITYPFSDFLLQYEAKILAIITGGLLYIALADIFPEFKGKGTTGKKFAYLLFVIIGIMAYLSFSILL